jgi:macrolide-specific efflux system membrane fusion protein
LGFILCFGAALIWMREVARSAPPPPNTHQIVLSGQLVCSLSRAVSLPFPGVILSVEVTIGQKVKAKTVLAKYRLAPEASLDVSRRISPPIIKELEVKLAEADEKLLDLRTKHKSLTQLARQNLTSPESLRQVEESLALMKRQRSALSDRLASERQLASENLALLQKQLGPQALSGKNPREGTLRAPIAGYVMWIHPDLRENAELAKPGPVFLVGLLDPMLIKAQVHEIEAMQLAEGDQAEVSLEALPGRTFKAKLSRLPWASLTAAPDRPSYFEVEFTVANPDLLLKEGLKARLVLNPSQK